MPAECETPAEYTAVGPSVGSYKKLPYRKLPDHLSFFAFFRKLNALGLNIFNKTSSVVYTTYFLTFKTKIFVCVRVVDVI